MEMATKPPVVTPLSVNASAEARKIFEAYQQNPTPDTFNLLLLGHSGCGKTSLLSTAKKPVLIDSFDPGGTKAEMLQPLIEKGDVLVRTFEDDDLLSSDPQKGALVRWRDAYNASLNAKLFDQVGTYVIDSASTFVDCLSSQILRKEGRMIPDMTAASSDKLHGLRRQDYDTFYRMFRNFLGKWLALPCDFILTGHVSKDVNEVTGALVKRFLVIGQSAEKVPPLFDEVWFLDVVGEKQERKLITSFDSRKFEGKSRRAGTKFDPKGEPADLKHMLKLMGLPTDDKPSLMV